MQSYESRGSAKQGNASPLICSTPQTVCLGAPHIPGLVPSGPQFVDGALFLPRAGILLRLSTLGTFRSSTDF